MPERSLQAHDIAELVDFARQADGSVSIEPKQVVTYVYPGRGTCPLGHPLAVRCVNGYSTTFCCPACELMEAPNGIV